MFRNRAASWIAATAATMLASAPVSAADEDLRPSLRVTYDQSTLLQLSRPAKIVIVGNPSVADAQLVSDTSVYVIGRMFGTTNIIAIDAKGEEVINTVVAVGASDSVQVTVYRGPSGQRNFACAPRCERSVTPGDPDMSAIVQDADKKADSAQKSAQLSSGR